MDALYYPFHLCHDHTLERLLVDYRIVHFRDFMALQLTPMMGTTAFPDRMGDYFPELLRAGRILQGHNLSGPMKPEMIISVNRDLADTKWRHQFQAALLNDPRFQRGLFAHPKDGIAGPPENNQDPEWLHYDVGEWGDIAFDVGMVQALSRQRPQEEQAVRFEYGWALIKTAASLLYTIQLCQQINAPAVTDSAAHYGLLARTCEREQISLENVWLKREEY